MRVSERGDDRRCFLTILDNVLTVGESAEGEEGAGWPHPHPRDLLEGAGGVCEKFHSTQKNISTQKYVFVHYTGDMYK